jgi:hypothetical protein
MKTQPMSSYPVYYRPAQPILPVSPRFLARPQLLTRLACLQSCQRWCRSTAGLERAFARAAVALPNPPTGTALRSHSPSLFRLVAEVM